MIRTKIDESLEAVHTHTHTHTHTFNIYTNVCYLAMQWWNLSTRQLYLTKISFDFCAKKSNKVEEIKQGNKQKNRRMDYVKNSLSFLRAKIYRRQKKRLKCEKNILINKDEYA